MSDRATDRADVPRIDATRPARAVPEIAPAARGTLVLLGGATSVDGRAFTSFLELVNGFSGGRIVGLTAASTMPGESASFWRATFRQAGAARVEIPEFDRRSPAVDERVAAMVREADGIFLGGGDQVTLVTALSGTRTAIAIKERYREGGVVCGTSAGAAALSTLTMAGGEIDREGNLVAQYIGPGLGLLGYDAIIDTHFSQRRRLQRLFFVVAGNTELLGVGIDEDTALIVRGDVGEVVGAGGVTFVDGRDTVRFDNADDLDTGRQLTLSHLRVGIVGTRHHLNLRERELHELVVGQASPHRRRA
ncbi:MAG TPA: cyanophycinase [Gemmatimonadaceae bacterium]|nr:cyanophycinase [Gemmatimonadaceae bacterium]